MAGTTSARPGYGNLGEQRTPGAMRELQNARRNAESRGAVYQGRRTETSRSGLRISGGVGGRRDNVGNRSASLMVYEAGEARKITGQGGERLSVRQAKTKIQRAGEYGQRRRNRGVRA